MVARRDPEAIIASAVARGAISAERAHHYRALAATGVDVTALDDCVAIRSGAAPIRAAGTPWRTEPISAAGGYADESPLVGDMRKSHPALVQAAMAEGPPPPLFGPQGGLPVTTASGLAPEALARLPWQARRPVAAAKSQAEAYRLAELAEDGMGMAELSQHPANAPYLDAVKSWLQGTEPAYDGTHPRGLSVAAAAGQDRQDADDDLTADALYAELFGRRP